MAQTPYQQELWRVSRAARTDRRKDVEAVLHKMIAALENDKYDDLRALRSALPADHAAMVGFPPRSRADDR